MLITWLSLFWVFLSSAQSVIVPEHNCNNYFDYVAGNKGVFTAPSGAKLPLKWKATFEYNRHREVFISPLMPYPNKEVSEYDISHDKQAKTFVQFTNISNELPKLTHFSLNGWTLCLNQGYGSPYTEVTVQYTMHMPQKQQNQNRNPNWNPNWNQPSNQINDQNDVNNEIIIYTF